MQQNLFLMLQSRIPLHGDMGDQWASDQQLQYVVEGIWGQLQISFSIGSSEAKNMDNQLC